jgi:hypothetical protein
MFMEYPATRKGLSTSWPEDHATSERPAKRCWPEANPIEDGRPKGSVADGTAHRLSRVWGSESRDGWGTDLNGMLARGAWLLPRSTRHGVALVLGPEPANALTAVFEAACPKGSPQHGGVHGNHRLSGSPLDVLDRTQSAGTRPTRPRRAGGPTSTMTSAASHSCQG